MPTDENGHAGTYCSGQTLVKWHKKRLQKGSQLYTKLRINIYDNNNNNNNNNNNDDDDNDNSSDYGDNDINSDVYDVGSGVMISDGQSFSTKLILFSLDHVWQ